MVQRGRQICCIIPLLVIASAPAQPVNLGAFLIQIVNEHAPNQVFNLVELDSSCAVVSLGQYTIKSPPTHGKVTWKTVTQPYYPPYQSACAGNVVKTNSVQYAWTSSLTGQYPSDSFEMEWSSGDGTIYDFIITPTPEPRIANRANYVNSTYQDITYTTQNVIAGQPVVLLGDSLSSFDTINWTLPGTSGQTYIGSNGFTPFVDTTTMPSNIICNASSGCPSVPYLIFGPLQVYFTQAISPASPLALQISGASPNVLYSETGSSTVNYAVSAPTVSGPTFTQLQPVGVQSFSNGKQYLGWGANFRPGIEIAASVMPPDIRTGTVYWYQVITRDKLVYYKNATTSQIYSCSTGLDDPDDMPVLPSGSTFFDGPNLALSGDSNNYVRISMTYEFKSYLMWQPNITTMVGSVSVPPTLIPLGYETWGFTQGCSTLIKSRCRPGLYRG